MIDCHAHLDDAMFGSDVEAIVKRAEAAGVRAVVTAGVDLQSSERAVELAEQYEIVYAAVGFHPHDAAKMQLRDVAALHALAQHPKVVAIGEIGLDYYRDRSPRDIQHEALTRQLDIAAQLGLPVVVHCREAKEDTLDVLTTWSRAVREQYGGRPLGMLHCFSEDLKTALHYIAEGFYISLAGPVTYPNAKNTQEVAAAAPLEWLLTETDSPYLPPQNQRGKRNEPSNVGAVVNQIVELRGILPEEVVRRTSENAMTLFKLNVPSYAT